MGAQGYGCCLTGRRSYIPTPWTDEGSDGGWIEMVLAKLFRLRMAIATRSMPPSTLGNSVPLQPTAAD
jgi:hypothetical protein